MATSVARNFISQTAANEAVQAALAYAIENRWNIAAFVVDPGGHMLAAGRLDMTPPVVSDFAFDKARTAVLGRPTRDFASRMLSNPELNLGLVNRPKLCAWEGGIPIFEDGILIGAIGVSGAAGSEDTECAKAAISVLGLQA